MRFQKTTRIFALPTLVVILGSSPLPSLLAQEAPVTLPDPPASSVSEGTDFINYEERPDGRAELQTATVKYRRADGAEVDLMGVIHVGDGDYYSRLDAQFPNYDGVLYELVGGPMPKDGQKRESPDAQMDIFKVIQRSVFSAIDLQSQLKGIDYGRDNFIHADVTWDEYAEMQSARNESMIGYLMKALNSSKGEDMEALLQSGENDLSGLVGAFMEFDPHKLKKSLAPMLGNAEAFISMMEGEEGSAIITDRNTVALGVMNRELAAGKRKLCLFYGAGHMPGMEEELLLQGFEKVSETWETAWSIGLPDPNRESESLLSHLMKDDEIVGSVFGFMKRLSDLAKEADGR